MSIDQNIIPYLAFVGDIRGSTQLADRYNIQNQFNEILQQINEQFADSIASKFVITLGDEFQGLLHNSEPLFFILQEIERGMYPVQIRFGIGIGTIHTEINPDRALGADGPAYNNARKAIEYLKQRENKNQTKAADIRIVISEDIRLPVELINTTLLLLTTIKQGWSAQQHRVIRDILAHRDTQSNVAKRLNISQPSVQKSLSSGNYYAYQEAVTVIEQTLRDVRWNHV